MMFSFDQIILIITVVIVIVGIRGLISRPAHGPIQIVGDNNQIVFSRPVHLGVSAHVNC